MTSGQFIIRNKLFHVLVNMECECAHQIIVPFNCVQYLMVNQTYFLIIILQTNVARTFRVALLMCGPNKKIYNVLQTFMTIRDIFCDRVRICLRTNWGIAFSAHSEYFQTKKSYTTYTYMNLVDKLCLHERWLFSHGAGILFRAPRLPWRARDEKESY